MKKGWKIALISICSLLGLVIVAVCIVLWLVFTPSQLTKIVNKLAGDYLLCEAKFEKVDLTLFKTFPDAGLKVDNVVLVNPMNGTNDTLANIESLIIGIDVKSYLKEKKVIVHQVLLDNAYANLFINEEGKGNFSIFRSSDEKDTANKPFSLDSLPFMDIRKVKISDLDAILDSRKGSPFFVSIEGLNIDLTGKLKDGIVDANLNLDGEKIMVSKSDCLGNEILATLIENVGLKFDGKGNMDNVDGKLKLCIVGGALRFNGQEMINEKLQASDEDLLNVTLPFSANLKQMKIKLDESEVKINDYALNLGGSVQLANDNAPMNVGVHLNTSGAVWQIKPLLAIVPAEYTKWSKGMDFDAKVELSATAIGTLTDNTMPLIDAKMKLKDGSFYYPRAIPYKIKKINGDLAAQLNLSKDGKSSAKVNKLTACTRDTKVELSGCVDDLLGDLLIDAAVKGSLPIADAMPMVPDKLKLKADGDAKLDLKAKFRISDLNENAFNRMHASGKIELKKLDVIYDSIHAIAPELDIALQLPAKEHKGKLADVHITGSYLDANMPRINSKLQKPDINVGVNNPMKEQLTAVFDIQIGETEANIDSMLVSVYALKLKGSMRMDSLQTNVLRKLNPTANIDLNSAVLYMPSLPDAVRLSHFAFEYDSKHCNIKDASIKIGHSDFQLYGSISNLEQWLSKEDMLRADINFTSNYADVDQLMDMFSGMGTDADTLEKMREEDNVPKEADPFIVPKDVDLTLHTHIKRSVAFGNDLNDVAGSVTINDGVAVLDQIGFVCKAATMQLTALYKSPRPDNLFMALDFHLLDVQIDELLDMIPAIDTLVPMLSAFNGNANFHLAAETFLFADYKPKMSSLLGSAAISGKDLVVMDNNSTAQIARLMQFKSWKDKDDKIKIDSLSVEMTCFRKEIEVFPFLLNIGKYQLCCSGKHTLDNNCGYHIELLKNPLMAKVGIDVRGNLNSPKISLGEVRYADLYKPEKQGVVEKQTLKLKSMIREALEKNVR